MKLTVKLSVLLSLSVLSLSCSHAPKSEGPVYLDDSQPIEIRVEDALSRMTLEEKVKIIHAQSKFSSAGVPLTFTTAL